jgi:hypothetical protein
MRDFSVAHSFEMTIALRNGGIKWAEKPPVLFPADDLILVIPTRNEKYLSSYC